MLLNGRRIMSEVTPLRLFRAVTVVCLGAALSLPVVVFAQPPNSDQRGRNGGTSNNRQRPNNRTNQPNGNVRPARPTPAATPRVNNAARRAARATIYTPEWAAASRAGNTTNTVANTTSSVAMSRSNFGPEGEMMPGAMPMDESPNTRGANRDGGRAMQALQNILKDATPEEKTLVQNYVRGLDRDRRRALSERLRYGNDAEKRENIIELAKSGRAPESAEEMRKRIGLPESPTAPEITIHGRSTAAVQVGRGAASATNKTSPLPSVGTTLPALTAAASDGTALRSLVGNGKPTILQVGSLTCPIYRGSIAEMNRAAQEHPSANFAVLYTLEAHPKGSASPYAAGEWIPVKNEKDQVLVPQTTSEAERAANAETLRQGFGEKRSVYFDTMDNASWRALGSRSHVVIVLDATGRVVEATESPSADKLKATLQQTGNPQNTMAAGMNR